MLSGFMTKHCAGIAIYGDWYDLKSVHACIHRLSGSPCIDQGLQKDHLLGLAYEFRKAYEKQREEKKFGFDEYDTVNYRGFKYFWPYYLSQVAMLRRAAAFMTVTRSEQSTLYLLESLAEETIATVDTDIARSSMDIISALSFPQGYLYSYIDITVHRFLETKPKDRISSLPALLVSMTTMSDEYKEFIQYANQRAKELGIKPEQLEVTDEFPDFKW